MRILEYIGQIVAAVIYTLFVTWLFSWAIDKLFMLLVSVSTFWSIVIFVISSSFIKSLVQLISVFVVYPFYWINRGNIVSVVLSVLITIAQVVLWIIMLFEFPAECNPYIEIVSKIYIMGLLLGVGYTFVIGQIGSYNNAR